MNNLAGNRNCDEYIRNELTEARIPLVTVERSLGEVPFTVVGQLGQFRFHRAWRYWVVDGPVPVEVAKILDATHQDTIRAGGHAGGHPVKGYVVTWLDPQGREIISTKSDRELRTYPNLYTEETRAKYCVNDSPASVGHQYVTKYHIDTQAGLNYFVKVLRDNKLVV